MSNLLKDGGKVEDDEYDYHMWVLTCGRRLVVTEPTSEDSAEEITRSMTRLAEHHLRAHHSDPTSPSLCDPMFAWTPSE